MGIVGGVHHVFFQSTLMLSRNCRGADIVALWQAMQYARLGEGVSNRPENAFVSWATRMVVGLLVVAIVSSAHLPPAYMQLGC